MRENRLTIALMLIAFAFSYLFHIYWAHWTSQFPEFFWNNHLMINNPDGYFYGSGAQKILYNMHMDNPRLTNVWGYGTAVITAFVVKFFHIPLDVAMVYLPPFISSLVVIPIILIGRLYNNLTWGFLAALIASIGWSYYNRTLAGYYDTDMFSAMLPMFILYFILSSIKLRSLTDVLIAGIFVLIYPWVYEQGLSIIYAMGIMAFLYLLAFNFKDEFSYKFIVLFSIALFAINPFVKLVLLLGAFYLLKNKRFSFSYLQAAAAGSFLIFFFTGNVFGIILAKIFSYSTSTQTYEGLKFLNVNKTVREAGQIPWYVVFDRISGSTIGLMISVIGYLLLLKKYKEFIIALPLWGIGFFAFIGGLRFTVYAVPIAAISGVYFFIYLADKIKKDKNSKLITITLGSLLILLPNITHILGCCENNKILRQFSKIYPISTYPYLTPTVMKKSEVEVLNELNKKSNEKDYAITWWDYGYPIWYYADVNTLIDGGKHNEDNFIVSKILTTSNQTLAYNLAKVSVKKYVESNKTVAPQLFIKDNKPIDVNNYLLSLGRDKKNIKLNRDIYFVLPYRMFNIFPTVAIFSNRNLNTGKVYQEHLFYKGGLGKKGNLLFIGKIPIDLKKGIILVNNGLPIKAIYLLAYDKRGKLIKLKQKLRDSGINLVILQSYGSGILMDDYYLNSTFVQMFLFENYNKHLFEPVILNPVMKIYKLK